jgi:hypothetical protein
MLSKNMQLIIIEMLETKGVRIDTQKIYGHPLVFHRSMAYLKKCDIVKCKREKKQLSDRSDKPCNKFIYYLTLDGEVIGMILKSIKKLGDDAVLIQ